MPRCGTFWKQDVELPHPLQIRHIETMSHWNVGRKIIEEEQSGNKRAADGEFLIKRLSAKLREALRLYH